MITNKKKPTNTTVAIYLTNFSNEKYFDFKLEKLKRYCKQKNKTIFRVYVDTINPYNSIFNRPQYNKMHEDAISESFQEIIVWDSHSLALDKLDLFTVCDIFNRLNIPLIAYAQSLYSTDNNSCICWSCRLLGIDENHGLAGGFCFDNVEYIKDSVIIAVVNETYNNIWFKSKNNK